MSTKYAPGKSEYDKNGQLAVFAIAHTVKI